MPRTNLQLDARKLTLDARPDRLDLRDRPYPPALGNLPFQFPDDAQVVGYLQAYADADLLLDQGSDGACTGFGLAAVINYLLFVQGLAQGSKAIRKASPAMLYQLARIYDEWPGEDYEGSSCRGALKGWQRHGVCREMLWPYVLDGGNRVYQPPRENPDRPDDADSNWDVDALACTLGVYYRVDARSVVDMQSAIHACGAIYVSATVHEGWVVPARKQLRGHADLARIKHVPKPRQPGGHAFAIVGYNELGFVVQNSWGKDWGSYGFALLPYEEWVTHGDDAWVFTLGISRQQAVMAERGKLHTLRSPHFFIPAATSRRAGAPERPVGLIAGDDALTRSYRDVPASARPLDADQAYRHTIVLDRGFPVRNDVTAETPAAALDSAVFARPLSWLETNGSNKLLVFVHGGLNSEGDSIERIRALAPYALNNGIYPLFITWRSGPLEAVSDLVEEKWAQFGWGRQGVEPARGWLDKLTDKTDRLLEPLLRSPGGALWQQMKINAERAGSHAQGGMQLMVARLKALAAKRPDLEIHLMGHSAGAIVLGALLEPLRKAGLKAKTLRLFAPACTTRFALDHYRPAIEQGVLEAKHWYVHVLSDKNENNDSVGPYRRSLLYLVSRSFEDVHKTPLLGLERSFDPATVAPGVEDGLWASPLVCDVAEWQAFWNGLGIDQTHRIVLANSRVSNGSRSISAAHGCFDNAVDIMGDALGYIVDPDHPQRVKIHRLDY